MSITTTLAAFQTINAAITGVTAAPAVYPGKLADFPSAITLPGGCTWRAAGLGGGRKAERTYHLRFYVAPEGNEAGTVLATCNTLLEAVGLVYRATQSVDGHPVKAVSDGGLFQTLPYAGQQFYGFEFRVTLLEEV